MFKLSEFRNLIKPTFLIIVAAILVVFILPLSRGGDKCRDCNVILISIDTLGAKHLSLYGYNRATSPFLDQLAKKEGVVFDRAIVQAPWTLPSHAAMLTGQYPADLGIWARTDSLPPSARTITQSLKDRGFRTQAFSTGPFVQPEWGFDRGFDGFSGNILPKDWQDSPKIFQDALLWIEKNSHNPFFLFIHSFQVHDPYLPSGDSVKALGGQGDLAIDISDIARANNRSTGPTMEENERFRLAYDAEIRDLDQKLAEFFQDLKSRGLWDKTIVILTSDHGEEFGEHGISGFHGVDLYDESLRVPLIIFDPKLKPERVSDVVEIRSIPTTILRLLGLSEDPYFKARSLFDRNESTKIALTTTALEKLELFPRIEKSYKTLDQVGKTFLPKPRLENWSAPSQSSAYSVSWHLIKTSQGHIELYDLKKDPLELDNVVLKWRSFSESDKKTIVSLSESIKISLPN